MKSYREIKFTPYIAPCSYFRIYAHELPRSVALKRSSQCIELG